MAFDHQVFARFLRTSCIALAVPLSALANAASVAPPPGGPQGPGHGCASTAPYPMDAAARGIPPPPPVLELDEAQQDAIFALNHNLAPLLREQARIARGARQALEAAMAAENFDEARVRELVNMAVRAEGELEVQQRIATRRTQDLLTDAQRAFLAQLASAEHMPPAPRGPECEPR